VAKLHEQLGQFLRKRRGDLTYAQFSRKLGISLATLQRLEHGEQNTTIKTLQQITDRLKCSIRDIFLQQQ
jgi:transcriptional regulator with XRE-family HTH domain